MTKYGFNESIYLLENPDVGLAVERGFFKSGFDHFMRFGKHEGRSTLSLSSLSRSQKALSLITKKGIGLEIGPSHNPLAPKSDGYSVHILDHLNADELKKKYAQHGVNLDLIEEVDFVWSGQSLPSLIGSSECYDYIIASHVIEHIPDLISFFQSCEVLLKQGVKGKKIRI